MKKVVISLVLGLGLMLGLAAVVMAINSNSTGPIKDLTSNPGFAQAGLEAQELQDQTKIDEATAIKKAKEVAGIDVDRQAAESAEVRTTAAKVRFTNNQGPRIPGKNIVLRDYPCWVVTFHNVTLLKNGPGPSTEPGPQETPTVIADENVVIDANSGEVLEIVSYTAK
ncbi:hypothetical protein [Candidatus Aquicultor secundus]|uniref:hypothetical protein n=1 Tax=Candidatus Aquicultor secundus TaxID=1973895 RepID=UPI00257F3E68|nr:hypothetical protein [Candidatus Aquicultor secundus]